MIERSNPHVGIWLRAVIACLTIVHFAIPRLIMGRLIIAGLLIGCLSAVFAPPPVAAGQSSASASDASQENPPNSVAMPRGKKLALKDGTFQLVREYQVIGDRVRYYSLDSSQWEEIPAILVDWEATKKIEAEEAQRDEAFAARAHLREQGRRAEALDVDASLEVAPGIFLPSGEGLFLFDGRSVALVAQAQTTSALNKKRMIEKVLVPIPLSTRHNVSVEGPHATFRIHDLQPEFYKRSANGIAPALQLIRAKVHNGNREFERLDEIFGEREVSVKEVPIQIWEIAPGLYRFTLGQGLVPGEYGIAEAIPGKSMEIYLWDFGVDPNGEPMPRGKK